jgi:protease-4
MAALAGEDQSDSAPADALATIAGAPEWQLKAALAELSAILSGPSIQARCLECGPVAPAHVEAKDAGFLASLMGWLGR